MKHTIMKTNPSVDFCHVTLTYLSPFLTFVGWKEKEKTGKALRFT